MHGGGLATYLINLGNNVSIVDILIFESTIFLLCKDIWDSSLPFICCHYFKLSM